MPLVRIADGVTGIEPASLCRRIIARFEGFDNVRRWAATVAERPATIHAYEKGAAINTVPTINEESKALLLGLTGGNAGDTGDRRAA